LSKKCKTVYMDTDKPWEEQDLGGIRPDKSVCIVRYGGYGDMLQISPIIKAYKDKGYYVCINASTNHGLVILEENPYIDEIYIQKTDQVPQTVLLKYWDTLALNFSKFINLSAVIEHILLPPPGNPHFYWPKRARHMLTNHNYMELLYAVADLPYNKNYEIDFFPSKEEKTFAKKEREEIGQENKVILWVLSGSSKHKVYPFMDEVIAKVLISKHKNVHFILVGDTACQILEYGWQNEPRIHTRSGVWTIRQTLAFLPYADLIIGPETGVLYGAATLDTPKIVMLSHSSPHNYSNHWRKTIALTNELCDCQPCHKLHYSDKYCNIDPDVGAAECCLIPGYTLFHAIEKFL